MRGNLDTETRFSIKTKLASEEAELYETIWTRKLKKTFKVPDWFGSADISLETAPIQSSTSTLITVYIGKIEVQLRLPHNSILEHLVTATEDAIEHPKAAAITAEAYLSDHLSILEHELNCTISIESIQNLNRQDRTDFEQLYNTGLALNLKTKGGEFLMAIHVRRHQLLPVLRSLAQIGEGQQVKKNSARHITLGCSIRKPLITLSFAEFANLTQGAGFIIDNEALNEADVELWYRTDILAVRKADEKAFSFTSPQDNARWPKERRKDMDSDLTSSGPSTEDIAITVSIQIDEKDFTFDQLSKLANGSVLQFNEKPEDSVAIYANNKHFANGTLLTIDDSLAVRIDELV